MILCRAEASKEYGLGHLKRCLIIADALKKHDEDVTFIVPEDNETALSLIQNAACDVQTIPSGLNLKDEINYYPEKFSFLITDIYHQGNAQSPESVSDYLSVLKERGIKIAFIDGLYDEAFRPSEEISPVEVFIQPYLGATNDTPAPAHHWLRGSQFAVMDSAYADLPAKEADTIQNTLITFGGADPQSLTIQSMRDLENAPDNIHVRVIIGPYFDTQHVTDIKTLATKNQDRFEVLEPQDDMIPHYQWAHIALTGSGLSRYECAANGLPALFTAHYPAHIRSSEAFAQSGAARYIGLQSDLKENDWQNAVTDLINNKEAWQAMSRKGQELIDGQGADRLAKKLLEIF